MTLKIPIQFNTTFGNYSATEIIGEGGSARVYKATDDDGQSVAIKRLDPAKITTEKLKRFKNEYLFCANNHHPNIVPVLDNGLVIDGAGQTPFFVMPLYGGSLRSLLETTIAPDNVLPYFAQLLDGVEAAHLKNVVHRDLKPENILHDHDNDTLLIADFGIAWFAEDDIYTEVATKENSRLANFQYAAPEQRDRGAQVDHRADIYSLGCILNEMFTGQIPYGTGYKTIEDVASEFQYLDVVVAQMLRRDPNERQTNLHEVKNQLIAQKNEFITQQRISELTNMVIPVGELDDPLIVDPPKLIDFDWVSERLTLILSRQVNERWIHALNNMGGHSSLLGYGPERFSFSGNRATIGVPERIVQDIINYFKGWLPSANAVYKQTIEIETRKAEEMERQKLQQELETQQARQRILRDVKI